MMANNPIHDPVDYSEELRALETTDPAHPSTFNPLFERLINNDAFLNALIAQLAGAGWTSENLMAHLAAAMPHIFTDGETTYRWGLTVIDGVVNMVYEEVTA
jgi:hypothetical protein